ncbi:hypothetical protein VSP20_09300 [Myroides phaeus]|uniref:hypothetical protein n=1 Tax=Myroides phaeus TaxID=702745 RepID=UPI002DBCC4F1|nr:hypothetical protein [Myroides phaeus]MEC4117168.1 hypothetical protein [Myroides phaeus]
MKTGEMLEYAKVVLQNVSIDPQLFYKELEKIMANMLPYEADQLALWVDDFVKEKPELQESLIETV